MAVKKGLGRGLDSMIPEPKTKDEQKKEKTAKTTEKKETAANAEPKVIEKVVVKTEIVPDPSGKPVELDIRTIDANRNQPRTNFDEESLDELSESIRMYGVIQPILVIKRGKRYEIIAGERRFRAAKLAGLETIPAIVREYSDQEITEIALIENLQREDLNPIEEAKAYAQLIETYNLKQEEVAEKVSKSRSAVTNALRLLKLEESVQKKVEFGVISAGHARALAAIEDKEVQREVADQIIDRGLSVRETEKVIGYLLHPVEEDKKDPVQAEDKSVVYRTLEETLKTILGSKVVIKPKKNGKGKIEIDYYSIDELDRISDMLKRLKV